MQTPPTHYYLEFSERVANMDTHPNMSGTWDLIPHVNRPFSWVINREYKVDNLKVGRWYLTSDRGDFWS